MCFELNIYQNKPKDNVYGLVYFLKILFDAIRIDVHWILFGHNLISKNFNKLPLVKSLFNQNTGKKGPRTLRHKLRHRSFHDSTLKQLQQNFRKHPEKHKQWSPLL